MALQTQVAQRLPCRDLHSVKRMRDALRVGIVGRCYLSLPAVRIQEWPCVGHASRCWDIRIQRVPETTHGRGGRVTRRRNTCSEGRRANVDKEPRLLRGSEGCKIASSGKIDRSPSE